ncbi:hypothetical protein [Thermus albus]|uniref:hypothetical protein n=1 Tax=Thermus albus TaxID=2908146 RepID=UPI001FAB0FCD|nr:hypothetical protein [Thermus albus]
MRFGAREFPRALGYGARRVRGGLRVELLSVHDGMEAPQTVSAYLYPGEEEICVRWPGYAPGLYRWQTIEEV